jgi:predicted amidohydrolase YtcJ
MVQAAGECSLSSRIPFIIYRARRSFDGSLIAIRRYPAEALTRTQALRGMTRDAAYASFVENTRGQLVPGFAADFVVLDRDIMRVPLEEILGTKVLATVVDGQIVYGSL